MDLRSPLADKFIRSGKHVLISGEIRPTDIVPVITPNRNGKESDFPMKWGFHLPYALSDMLAEKT